jgi:hypothetical protein
VRGEKVLDLAAAVQYLVQLEQASVNIVDAFNKQVTKAFDDWNQARFEELLAQWLQSFIWLVLQSKTLFNVPYVLYTTVYGHKAHHTVPSAYFFFIRNRRLFFSFIQWHTVYGMVNSPIW